MVELHPLYYHSGMKPENYPRTLLGIYYDVLYDIFIKTDTIQGNGHGISNGHMVANLTFLLEESIRFEKSISIF